MISARARQASAMASSSDGSSTPTVSCSIVSPKWTLKKYRGMVGNPGGAEARERSWRSHKAVKWVAQAS